MPDPTETPPDAAEAILEDSFPPAPIADAQSDTEIVPEVLSPNVQMLLGTFEQEIAELRAQLAATPIAASPPTCPIDLLRLRQDTQIAGHANIVRKEMSQTFWNTYYESVLQLIEWAKTV